MTRAFIVMAVLVAGVAYALTHFDYTFWQTVTLVGFTLVGIVVGVGVWFLSYMTRPTWPPQTRVERFIYWYRSRRDEADARKYGTD